MQWWNDIFKFLFGVYQIKSCILFIGAIDFRAQTWPLLEYCLLECITEIFGKGVLSISIFYFFSPLFLSILSSYPDLPSYLTFQCVISFTYFFCTVIFYFLQLNISTLASVDKAIEFHNCCNYLIENMPITPHSINTILHPRSIRDNGHKIASNSSWVLACVHSVPYLLFDVVTQFSTAYVTHKWSVPTY